MDIADGTIASVAQSASREGAERIAGIAIPGLPNLHCHAFQRGMAGLAERRGPSADSFWTWREVMYRFLDRLSPDDVQVIAAFAYMQMLEAGFTTVGEFHYLHHDVDGRPYADLGEMAARIAAASTETRIGLICNRRSTRMVVWAANLLPRISGASSTTRISFSGSSSAHVPSWQVCPRHASALRRTPSGP
jgi:cytosine/adenosine deaminase-related metal-dependent hydrolase